MNRVIRIIPSILILDKRVVKGKNFKNHIDCGDPVTTLITLESQMSDEITIIDLNASKNLIDPDLNLLKKICNKIMTPICFGGGINNFEKAKNIIRCGADKILINQNLDNEVLIKSISDSFGSQSIVGGIDLNVKNGNYVVQKKDIVLSIDPIKYIEKINNLPIGEIKITFINLEGCKTGTDIEYLKKILKLVSKPLIIEGGLGSLMDISDCCKAGLDSFALGAMIFFADNNIFKIKNYLANEGFAARLR